MAAEGHAIQLNHNLLKSCKQGLQKIVGWQRLRIREFFESYGLLIQEWERARTDWLTLRPVITEASSAA